MWTKTTCEQETLRPYQACLCVCQKGILENQGSRSLGQHILNRLGPLKVCLQVEYLEVYGSQLKVQLTQCCFCPDLRSTGIAIFRILRN